MGPFRRFTVGLLGLFLLTGCGAGEPSDERIDEASLSAPMFTLTTSSPEARQHMIEAQKLWDVGKPLEAHEHFKLAAAADPSFALAHLYVGQSQFRSPAEFRAELQKAIDNMANASESERLLIESQQKLTLENDVEGAIEAARRLTALEPQNPRAWDLLAFRQSIDAGNEETARASWMKALEVNPRYYRAHAALAFSYTQAGAGQQDPVKAEEHALKLVELEPNEPNTYDFLGDARRTQGKLQEAAEAYTKMAELDPTSAAARQQRAHVHMFLGNYEAARADYDESMKLAKGQAKFGLVAYRPLVHLIADNPKAAIDEIEELITAVDGMGIPNPDGAKLGALGGVVFIALHNGYLDVAQQAIERQIVLWNKVAEQVGTPEVRRNQDANIAAAQGFLAAYQGNYALATQRAQEFMKIVEPVRDPRKNDRAHEILGVVALRQKKYAESLAHFEQSNRDATFNSYLRARALEGAGRVDEAKQIYKRLAGYYFADPALVLVRKEVLAKAS